MPPLIICSHGLRTGIFEASKLVLINFAPTLPELQVICKAYMMLFIVWATAEYVFLVLVKAVAL